MSIQVSTLFLKLEVVAAVTMSSSNLFQ